MEIKISEKLKHLPRVDYRTLKEFQGELKELSEDSYAKLLKSFSEFGFIVPIFVWKNNGEWMIIDAHQRIRVMKQEGITPYEIPYIEIEADNESEAKKRLLVISSQYGHVTQEGFDAFTYDLEESWLKTTTKFDGLYDFSIANDPIEEWKGMPEFNNEEVSVREVVIKFQDQKAVNDFAKATNLKITDDTKYAWYPEMIKDPRMSRAYKGE